MSVHVIRVKTKILFTAHHRLLCPKKKNFLFDCSSSLDPRGEGCGCGKEEGINGGKMKTATIEVIVAFATSFLDRRLKRDFDVLFVFRRFGSPCWSAFRCNACLHHGMASTRIDVAAAGSSAVQRVRNALGCAQHIVALACVHSGYVDARPCVAAA